MSNQSKGTNRTNSSGAWFWLMAATCVAINTAMDKTSKRWRYCLRFQYLDPIISRAPRRTMIKVLWHCFNDIMGKDRDCPVMSSWFTKVTIVWCEKLAKLPRTSAYMDEWVCNVTWWIYVHMTIWRWVYRLTQCYAATSCSYSGWHAFICAFCFFSMFQQKQSNI